MSEVLNADKENAIRILDYWFMTEFLNQQNLKAFKEIGKKTSTYKKDLISGNIKKPKKVVEDFVQLAVGDNLQTVLNSVPEKLKDFYTSDFTVFIGCMKKETCIREIAKNVQWASQSPDAKAENKDEIALAILKFSKDGIYISNSLSISPLAWAMMRLSGGTENSSQKLSSDNYNSDTRTIETKIENLIKPSGNGSEVSEETEPLHGLKMVSHDLLTKIENIVCDGLNVKDKDISSYLAVYFKLYKSENDFKNDESGAEVSLYMDFYSKDLAFVADGLRNNYFTKEKEKFLIDYTLGISRYNSASETSSNRIDVVKPKNEEDLFRFMLENLTAEKAPLGKWPSRFMPALMQQIAVNLATAPNMNLPVFSVNGPPGTGKTTLLKEIIVSNIVEKAILLAAYDDPDDAFDDFSFSHGEGPGNSYNEFYRKYHKLKDKKINGYSMLVASSNNNAVENVTKELPVEENILENIQPAEGIHGPNEEALAELSKLFTVSESEGRLPLIQEVWKEYINEKGEKKKHCQKIIENQPDIYFSRLATDLINADAENKNQKKVQAFGLISAPLGKKQNIEKVETNIIDPFLDIIGTNTDITPRKQNYLETRKKFLAQLEVVKDLRKELGKLLAREKAVSEACRMVAEKEHLIELHRKEQRSIETETDAAEHELQKNINRLNKEKEKNETEIAQIRIACAEVEEKRRTQQNYISETKTKIEELQKSVSIFGRLFKSTSYKKTQESIAQEYEVLTQCLQQMDVLNKKLDEENRKVNSVQAEINSLTAEIGDESTELRKICSRREIVQSKGQRLERELAVAKKKAEDQKKLLERERENYQNQDPYERGFILDRHFISDILSTDQEKSTKAQLRNPWFSEHYNREREKLFLYSLQMTKEFILSSKKCRNNLRHLHCLWSGSYYTKKERKKWKKDIEGIKFTGDDLDNCTAAVYETLFLLIPVVSSTFASVQSFFRNVKEEDIVGMLIVDEAGQASPHMAIGALCRSRKAVIVGDPNQVEPVVTDDQDLLKQTYTDDFFVPYKDKTNSVQRFADIMNPYGTYLKNAQGVEEWVGCPLLVHRRCISPMYEISNDISYSNIMKQQTAQPDAEKQKLFIAEKSQWFNVRGKEEGIKRHFVKEQGEKVVKMLEVAFSKNPDPDIFIISPFTTVESGIKDYVEKYVKNCKVTGEQSFLLKHESSLYDWLNKHVGTVHKFQGREAAEVIFLLGCDTSEEARPAIRWVNNNIVNVAATRAKYRFYVIGDIEAWKKSKCVNRARKIIDSYVSGNLDYARKNQKPDGSYTLIITEKRSVAEAYAKALCVWNEPSNDFYEGNGYLISWCLGHLVELAAPEQYNEKYKKWNIADLPIIPDVWKYQLIESKNPDIKKRNDENKKIIQRFDALKTLMNRDDVTDIICATDAGREGELIFRLVYRQAGCKKPFKRIWLSSMEPVSVRKAFENPNPGSDYDSLYEAARCRQLADWIVGMNATRFYTCRYKDRIKELGEKTLRVGRVVSPTLAMVVERENEIDTFIPETYYTVNLNVGGITFKSKEYDNEDDAIRVINKLLLTSQHVQ